MRVSLLVFSFLALAAPARAERVVIDLAAGLTLSLQRPAGTPITFVIHNRLPTKDYVVTVETRRIPIPEFDPMELGGYAAGANACDDLVKDVKSVYAATTEKEVAAAIEPIEKAVEAGTCNGPDATLLTRALAETRYALPVEYIVQAGQEIEVTITRGDKTWAYSISGGSRGEWLVSYGASVLADRGRRATLKAAGENEFVVTDAADPEGVRVVPSVFFTWMPSKVSGDWAYGPTAGFGIDSKAPGLFAGWSGTYNHNLMFAAGVSLAQHQRLRGKYTVGETLKEQLDEDQLMENVYLPSWLIAVTLRFGQNPFKGGSGDEAVEADPKKAGSEKGSTGAGRNK